MSLAEFAKQLGISLDLAKEWLDTGKIVATDGGWEVAAFLGRERDVAVDAQGPTDNTPKRDKAARRRFATILNLDQNPDLHAETCPGCAALVARVAALDSDVSMLRLRVGALEKQVEMPREAQKAIWGTTGMRKQKTAGPVDRDTELAQARAAGERHVE